LHFSNKKDERMKFNAWSMKRIKAIIFYTRTLEIIIDLVNEKHPEILLEAIKKALDEIA